MLKGYSHFGIPISPTSGTGTYLGNGGPLPPALVLAAAGKRCAWLFHGYAINVEYGNTTLMQQKGVCNMQK